MSPKQKNILTGIIMSTISVFITFVIVEVALRYIRPQPTYSRLIELVGEQYAPGDFIPFTLKTNYTAKSPSQEYLGTYVTYTTNSLGLRGKEISITKPKEVKRILILGDSYTFGVHVENDQTYPAILEKLLLEDGYQVEIINAGYADGWSPDEHYAWLINKGLEFEPDLIIYGFFIGNDIPESGKVREHWVQLDERNLPVRIKNDEIYIDELGRIRSKVRDEKTVGVDQIYRVPLIRDSHAFVLLWKRLVRLFVEPEPFIPWGDDPFPFIFKEKSTPEMLEGEHIFWQLVEGMNDVAKEHEADFVVLMIPINFQAEPDFLPQVVTKWYQEEFSIKRNYFDELKPKLKEADIPYLDLLEKMKLQPLPGKYFNSNGEVHFNPNGNLFTAEQLKTFIDTAGYLRDMD